MNTHPGLRHMPPRIPVNRDDRPRRLRVLHLLADVCGTKGRLAELIGVSPSTVSQWFNGDREPEEWHALLATAARVLRHYPSHEAQVVQAIVSELFDVQGAWLPAVEDTDEEQTMLDHAADLVEVGAAALGAIRRDDCEEIRCTTRKLVNLAIGLAARGAA